MEKTMYGILKTTGICPIMVEPAVEAAVPAARALVQAGLPVCEILMRNDNSRKYLSHIAKEVPEIIVGAGSVLNVRLAEEAVDLGAQFCVLPGFSREVVEFCLKKGISVLPGCSTATELMMALDYGINIVKFYPVYQLGGVDTLAQYNNGPFGMIEWVVTGGLGSHNFLPLLRHKNTLAAGGDWMFADGNAINTKNYDLIEENTRKSIQSVLDMRNAMKNGQ